MQFKQAPVTAGSDSLVDDATVFQHEMEEINRRRAARIAQRGPVALASGKVQSDKTYSGCFDTVGLALSGGGIRSAAFSTGAMQALARNGIYEQLDYVSTVSGGGYTGIAATLAMAETGQFPFFDKEEKKDTPAMNELRNNANYLKAGQVFEMIKNAAIYLRGIAANILLVGPWLILLAGLTLIFNPTYSDMQTPDFLGKPLPFDWGSFSLTIFLLVGVLLLWIGWAIGTFDYRKSGIIGPNTAVAAGVLCCLVLVAFVELHPFLVLKMVGDAEAPGTAGCSIANMIGACVAGPDGQQACRLQDMAFACQAPKPDAGPVDGVASVLGDGGGTLVKWLAGMLTAFSVALTGLSTLLGNVFKQDEQKGGIVGLVKSFFESRVLWWIAAAIFPLLLWLVYLLLVYWGMSFEGAGVDMTLPTRSVTLGLVEVVSHLPPGFDRIPMFYTALGLVLILTSLFLSANENSPHRLYRDRLGQAFCFVMQPEAGGTAEKPQPMLDQKLSALVEPDLARPAKRGPYHLINTALNIAGDRKVNMRGRNADFFLLSPLYVGSRATGYARTADVEQLKRAQSLDAATAMAISGAAFSSNMGSATIKLLRFTLAFFNVRLGYWFPNPKQVLGTTLRPMFLYFLQEVTGKLDSDSDMVYLSDGGHIDNLGLYELLRRRCQVIIVVDAEADSEMTFPSFVTAQRHARIDLGVRIEMSWTKLADTSRAAQKGDAVAGHGPHVSIGRIFYEGDGKGVLIYVKSSVTGDENDYVKDYNRRHKDFPHQTTGDQFFSEEQFEVYRSLGFHAVDRAFHGEDLVEIQNAELVHLLDESCDDACVAEVVERLGLTPRPYDKPTTQPTIHQVRLLPEEGPGLPLQISVKAQRARLPVGKKRR